MSITLNKDSEFLQHLTELRRRLIIALSAIMLIFVIAFYYSNNLFHLLSLPLLKYLPAGGTIIATEITSPFTVPLRLAFFVAIILALPVIFFQLWSFVAPGLYKHEKKIILPLTAFSISLFFIGMVFCYLVFFPLLFQVFISLVPQDITIMTDMAHYLDFCLRMLLIFGATFQIPIAIIFLIKIKLINRSWLKNKRPYFIIAALVVSMILTPPDVISMLLLAAPICLLYEAGILIASFIS